MARGFPFVDWGVAWADVKHAYEVRRERYGWSNRNLNAYCRLAIQARDWPTAKECMREIDGRWDDVIWSDQNEFVWNELMVSLR
jgi:hypothetical protein